MFFTTATDHVRGLIKRIGDIVTTTTKHSESEFTAASTVSDNAKREFTSSDSSSMTPQSQNVSDVSVEESTLVFLD